MNYTAPGVYIEEIPTLPASVAGVATAIPAFIGYVETMAEDGDANALLNVPTRITSFLEYEAHFGGAPNETIGLTITDTYDGDNVLTDRTFEATLASPSDFMLYHSMRMYFANGGGPCYVVAVGDYNGSVSSGAETPPAGLLGGLAAIKKIDEPTLLVFPDQISVAGVSSTYNAALTQCRQLKDRFVIMDVKEVTDDPNADATNFRDSGIGIDNLRYGAAYYPYLKTVLNYGYDETALNITHTVNGTAPGGAPTFAGTLENLNNNHPSVYRSVLVEMNKLTVTVPPSGVVAGIYARVDRERGVWKAPANVGVRNVVGPSHKISQAQQEGLNVDSTGGKSINVIRSFAGKGTLVWGARTLAGNDNEWRYVNV
ncbi:MAG: phage tail sheath subtilisin-like domain-containing protein, partial [Cyclobacteriaceae bacterium]